MGGFCDILDKITGCEVPEGVAISKDPKARYSRIKISLYTAFTDREYHLAGNFLGVGSISSGGSCMVKLDLVNAQSINLREVKEIKANFSKLYITSDGMGGYCYLYICQAMEAHIEPKQYSSLSYTVYSAYKNSTNIVRRVTEYSNHIYAKRLKIHNIHAANDVEFGYVPYDDIPSTATFRGYSYKLAAGETIEFTDVDLLSLGFVSSVDDAPGWLEIIATMV